MKWSICKLINNVFLRYLSSVLITAVMWLQVLFDTRSLSNSLLSHNSFILKLMDHSNWKQKWQIFKSMQLMTNILSNFKSMWMSIKHSCNKIMEGKWIRVLFCTFHLNSLFIHCFNIIKICGSFTLWCNKTMI